MTDSIRNVEPRIPIIKVYITGFNTNVGYNDTSIIYDGECTIESIEHWNLLTVLVKQRFFNGYLSFYKYLSVRTIAANIINIFDWNFAYELFSHIKDRVC